MNPTVRTAIAVVSIGVIAVCSVLLFSRVTRRARLADLTEENLYSLSDGTKRILGKLNQPISLKLYYSRTAARKGPEQVRFWNNYYLYVRDLLAEYVGRTKGKLSMEVVDPRPYSDAEEEAIAGGVRRFQLPNDESFFFGLVATNEFGKSKVIKFFEPDRQELVEYDLSKLISELTQRDKKKIAVISSLPIMGADISPYMAQMLAAQGKPPSKPWGIIEQLKGAYEVSKVDIDDAALDDDVDFLMVVHPKNLDEKTLFAIDQYVMKGGKLLVLTDPHCMQDRPTQQQRNPYAAATHDTASDLNSLLRGWGVEMIPGAIAVDRSLAVTGPFSRDGSVAPFPPYLMLNEQCANSKEVVTANLHSIQLLYSGVLQETTDCGTDVQPLLQTTPIGNAWTPSSPYELRMTDAAAISRSVGDGSEPLMLACLIRGKFRSNFPDGIDVKGPAENTDAPDASTQPSTQPTSRPTMHIWALKESAEGAAVVVVADVDIMSDPLAYRESFFGTAQLGDNAPFVLNVLDFLAGEADLITVRTRGRYSRPFEVVDRIERQAAKATADEVEAINQKISNYQTQLGRLGANAKDKDVKLLQSEVLAKRRKIETDIRKANKDLRQLQAKRREKVEALAWRLQLVNMAAAPSIILLIAIVLAAVRRRRAKRYAARRAYG